MTKKEIYPKSILKKPIKTPFAIDPKTEDEIKYIESLKSLLEHKRSGDWGLIGEMLKIEAGSAQRAFFRVFQKNHFEVVGALKEIIKKRTELIKTAVQDIMIIENSLTETINND